MALTSFQILELVVKGQADGQDILNLFHIRSELADGWPDPGADVQDTLAALASAWQAAILPNLSVSYQTQSLVGRVIDGTALMPPDNIPGVHYSEIGIIQTLGTEWSGQLPGEPLPTFCCAGFRKVTDRPGRRWRGSSRLSPFTEAEAAGNQLLEPYKTNVRAGYASFILPFQIGDFGPRGEFCVFSATQALSEAIPSPPNRGWTARIVGSVLNEFVTSQVSRKKSLFATT